MKNRRIAYDMADRPGAAFVRANSRALAIAPAKLRASPNPTKGATRSARTNQRGAEIPTEWNNMAELKILMEGQPLLFRFALDESLIKTLLGAIAGRAGSHSPLQNALGEMADQGSETTIASQTVLRVGPLELDLLDRTAKRGERKIDLRPREFRLLQYMMERSDKILTRESLLRDVWNYKFVPRTNLVDVHMGRLRRKVDGPNEPAMICNVRGAGFVLNANPLSHH